MIWLPFVRDLSRRISSPICSWPTIFCVHTSAILLFVCLLSPKFVVTPISEVHAFTNLLWPQYPKFTHSPICCDPTIRSSRIHQFVVTPLFEVNAFTNLLWLRFPNLTHPPFCWCGSTSEVCKAVGFKSCSQVPYAAAVVCGNLNLSILP